MFGKTEKEQSETLNTQNNSEGDHSSKSGENQDTKELYLNEEIEGAEPLRIVGNKDKGYCITFGKYRITELHPTPTAARERLFDRELQWQTIINLCGAILGQTGKDTKK